MAITDSKVGEKTVGEKTWLTRVGKIPMGEKTWLTRVGEIPMGKKTWRKSRGGQNSYWRNYY